MKGKLNDEVAEISINLLGVHVRLCHVYAIHGENDTLNALRDF